MLRRERVGGAIAALVSFTLIAAGLIFGLRTSFQAIPQDALNLFVVPPPAPPPPPEPQRHATDRPEGKAAPPSKKATPTEIVAPKPKVVTPPLPIPAAPVAGSGSAAKAGATPHDGPGTGAGGVGNGLGSGGDGNGTGGGVAVRAQLVSGTIRNADYPRSARDAHAQGDVTVSFTVGTDGRPRGCSVVVSSGNTALDGATCTLIEQRFRYRPARNLAGNPVPELRGWRQSWWLERR